MNGKRPLFLNAILVVFLMSVSGVQAADSYSCREECIEARQKNLRLYQKCVERAQGLSDPLATIKAKKGCRQKYPIPECEELSPCENQNGPKATPLPEIAEDFQIGSLVLVADQAKGKQKQGEYRFYRGQTIWIRYEILVGKRKGKHHWFDQEYLVVDPNGNILLQDQTTFEQDSEMSASYNLKSSFSIPKDFPVGKYQVKIKLRERYSSWEGTKEITFQVVG
jgi:hypothetical protein